MNSSSAPKILGALQLSGSYFVDFFVISETTFETSFQMSLSLEFTKKVVFLLCKIIKIKIKTLVLTFFSADFAFEVKIIGKNARRFDRTSVIIKL